MIIVIIMIRMSLYRTRDVKVDPGSGPSPLCNSLCGKHLNGWGEQKKYRYFSSTDIYRRHDLST